jgi:molecular chaperone GrpE
MTPGRRHNWDAEERAAEQAARIPTPEPPLDPELIEDLGAEFELRGDVMEDEVEVARAEAAEMRDRALRTQAEFDNFRKRITREREEERRRASERLVTELLPALDNLERAIAHTTAGGDLKHLLAGVEAVYAQIVGVLGKEGVTVIDPTGEHFDPMTQQAVSQKDDPSVPEGTVVEVFQKGYSLGDRVIRSAMVVVSTGGPTAQE